MEEQDLAKKISQAMDLNLSQIFNEIDLKVKSISFVNAEKLSEIKPNTNESKVFVFSELKADSNKIKAVIIFNKLNAMMMVDLIKGAQFGTTKLLSSKEINALKVVSSNLFKACVNSLNSVTNSVTQLTQIDVAFSFSGFENEFVAGNLIGKGRLFELSLTVGGTDIKGEMKFFAPEGMIK
ncbi:MAG: hypothetical protein COT90_05750 [Candidatus Diapherotrites archaeon CG10_big_fil_rev_8_21_14_0_10_31_34]|nr:MAG: hypothetical protein COT90_05750 [Candidatus Diapherotrites archaeon CG10_big_fil_rev_8_21_14_0_10_31_34]